MINFLKQISLHNGKEKCLVCSKPAGKGAAVVNFRYQGGTGQAFVCKQCADEMDKTHLDDTNYDTI